MPRYSLLLVLAAFLFFPLHDVQALNPEIQAPALITGIMKDSLQSCKTIIKTARQMMDDAAPFNNARYAARFRFKPNDKPARNVLNQSRVMYNRFRMVGGIFWYAKPQGADQKMAEIYASLDTIATAAKRSIRAAKDSNPTLWTASAQTLEKEALAMSAHISDLEDMINSHIATTDAEQEDL